MFSRPARILSVISLISVGLTVALWMRSYGYRDVFPFKWGGTHLEFVFFEGRIRLDDEPQRALIQRRLIREAEAIDARIADASKSLPIPEDFTRDSPLWNEIIAMEDESNEKKALAAEFERPINWPTGRSISFGVLLLVVAVFLELQIATLLLAPVFNAIKFAIYARSVRARGHCVNCGYDLRASSDRCPECGTAISNDGARSMPPRRSNGIE